jgi:MFS family permease
MTTIDPNSETPALPPHVVERAVKLSCAQAMLTSVYVASTGGMFIIGYALALGAGNAEIGMMSTVPMLMVVAQLVASALVERGTSRRSMTIVGSLLNVSGWAFVAALPFLMRHSSSHVKLVALIAAMGAITVFAHFSGNARGSWIGDLIPADMRGWFFGRTMRYAGIIGTVFALMEGTFLDHVRKMGISAFSWLFVFGMAFGLISTLLFMPQPDIRLALHEHGRSLAKLVRETFRNKPLMLLMAFTTVWALQLMAAPFYATYLLRDLKVPFLGLGVINAASTMMMLASSPYWGRIVDRYGCRPVIVVCTSVFGPTMLVWLFVTSAAKAYAFVIPANLLQGFLWAGISVGLNTLVYNITPTVGRSTQLAVYSIVVTLAAAPMPAIGGRIPGWLESAGIHTDLRITFYISMMFIVLSAFVARRIREEKSRAGSELLRDLARSLRAC